MSLRIALVTRRYWPQVGGPENMLASLASEFARQGANCTIVTAQWEAHWPTECLYRDVPIVRLPQPAIRGWGTIRYMHSLSRWLRKHRHELDAVIVSRMRYDAYAAIKALRATRVPVLVRAEGAGERSDLAWQQEVRFGSRIKQACLAADAIIAPTELVADDLHLAGFWPSKTHVIGRGVTLPSPDIRIYKQTARQAMADANLALEMVLDQPLVVYCGRLHDEKGLRDLVHAWVPIARHRPNARLWLIGEGPAREPLYDLIVDLNLHHQVFLPGAFDDVSEILAAADLLVLPSHAETQSLALLEAMAVGVPVVATDTPAQRLLIRHEEHGLLIPPNDPSALTAAIERLIDDPTLAKQLAQQAKQRVAHEFSLVDVARQHLSLIEQAIAARR